MGLGMKLTPEYVWSDDIIALRKEQYDLFLQIDGALSMHAQGVWLDPFFARLYKWLRARLDAQQADLPKNRRVPYGVLESRGDDILEGMCVANCQQAAMDDHTSGYFLVHVRPLWQRICIRKGEPECPT